MKEDNDMSNTRYALDTLEFDVGQATGLVPHRSSVSALRSGLMSRYSTEKPRGGTVESEAARLSSSASPEGAVSMRRAGIRLGGGTVESEAALSMSCTEIEAERFVRTSSGGLVEDRRAVSIRHTEVSARRSVRSTANGTVGIQETFSALQTEITSRSSIRRVAGIDTNYEGLTSGRKKSVVTKQSIALGAVGGLAVYVRPRIG